MGLILELISWCRICLLQAAIVSGLLVFHPIVNQTGKIEKLLCVNMPGETKIITAPSSVTKESFRMAVT